jgi:serine/threonine protein kinase
MSLECPSCHRILAFTGNPPSFCAYCGRPLPDQQPQQPGGVDPEAATTPPRGEGVEEAGPAPQSIGGYRLLRLLGEGGMGAVYEAEDSSSGLHVALKLISGEFAMSEENVRRFRQEGRLAGTISHPRCVFVLAADQEAGQPYIVMELMPGANLQDLVKEQGPLPVEEAVAKILDVIDGLQQAHQIGIIHRDVKPSNCFLESDGRVKIGDFGLAKVENSPAEASASGPVRLPVGGGRLTRTGAFIGTPLYASPEQIKQQPLDQRSDVYSVAATLFYLLIGRAPFESGDVMTTMARIVSDPPPSLHQLRPDIPPALDKVVLRGLERDRGRRWQDLEGLRRALLPFVRSQLASTDLHWRIWAFLIDLFPLLLGIYLFTSLFTWVVGFLFTHGWLLDGRLVRALRKELLLLVPYLLYFTLLEGVWGCSLGKRLFRLRVCPRGNYRPPGLARALWRGFLMYTCLYLPTVMLTILAGLSLATMERVGLTDERFLFQVGGSLLGIVALFSTMRRKSGYRGLHEFLSGTRVVRLILSPRGEHPRRRPGPMEPGRQLVPSRPTQTSGLPARIGSFKIQRKLPWGEPGLILEGYDPSLDRKALIWLRADSVAPCGSTRRQLSRSTRLRWLAGGRHGDRQWDAFTVPQGQPLSDLVEQSGRFFWPTARPILERVTDEVVEACAEGTLPAALAVDQVWIQLDGQIQLLDFPVSPAGEDGRNHPQVEAGKDPDVITDAGLVEETKQQRLDPERGLVLLRQVATLLMEGSLRPVDDLPSPIRAPLPLHAVKLLNGLLGVRSPHLPAPPFIASAPSYQLEQFQSDLIVTRDLPLQVSSAQRGGQMLGWDLVVSIGMMSNVEWVWKRGLWDALLLTNIWPVAVVLWAWLTCNLLPSWFSRPIFLVRSDGGEPRRGQAVFRALLVWGPISALFSSAVLLGVDSPAGSALSQTIWWLAVGLLVISFALAVSFPNRSMHDRLAGTYLVPE